MCAQRWHKTLFMWFRIVKYRVLVYCAKKPAGCSDLVCGWRGLPYHHLRGSLLMAAATCFSPQYKWRTDARHFLSPHGEKHISSSQIKSWFRNRLHLLYVFHANEDLLIVGFTLTLVNDSSWFLNRFSTNCPDILQARWTYHGQLFKIL